MSNNRSSRRSNGEGTEIWLGSDGRYHALLSFGLKAGGKRDRRHVSGKTRADVSKKLRALQATRDAGLVPVPGKSPTLAEWLRHWLEHVAAARVRVSTLDDYRSRMEYRVIPALGHIRLDQLQPEHLEAFYRVAMRPQVRIDGATGRRVSLRPLSAASVLKTHRMLSRALKIAQQRGRVARNVCTLVEPPAVRRDEIRPLTREEAIRVLNAADALRNSARWSVALALGLRAGEALGLTWTDIDLDSATLTVRRALQRQIYRHGCGPTCDRKRGADCPHRIGGGLVFVEPKSRAGWRTIALPEPLVLALKQQRIAQDAERLVAGSMWNETGLVFATLAGGPIDPHTDWKDWRSLLGAAGVRSVRLHDARHTAATLLLTQGVPARVAMQILGHSQISLTLGTYSHVAPELARDAADRIGSALWGDQAPFTATIGNRSGTGTHDSDEPSTRSGLGNVGLEDGAALEIRTPDLRITSPSNAPHDRPRRFKNPGFPGLWMRMDARGRG
jgi:integrase